MIAHGGNAGQRSWLRSLGAHAAWIMGSIRQRLMCIICNDMEVIHYSLLPLRSNHYAMLIIRERLLGKLILHRGGGAEKFSFGER